jgi:alpha-tubulin suppressor-like RCC1 family protein
MAYAEDVITEAAIQDTQKVTAATKRSFPLWMTAAGGAALVILIVLLIALPRGEQTSKPESVPTLAATAVVPSPTLQAEPSSAVPAQIPVIPIQTPTPAPTLTRAELAQTNRYTVACGNCHVAYIDPDGNCFSVGSDIYGQRSGTKINGSEVLRQLAAGYAHTVMLFEDGSVRATQILNPSGAEPYDYGQSDVGAWKNIVQIEAGWVHTVGLLSNGDVVAAGDNAHGQCEVTMWHDVVEIAAGGWNTAALTADGRVLVAGDNEYGQCDIDWSKENIVHIAMGRQFIVGLRADGTVIAAGRDLQSQLDVSDWQDIVMIATGDYHTIGLTDAGNVVSTSFTGSNDYGQDLTGDWENIIAVYGGARSTVGLTTDGTLLVGGLVDADTYANTGAMPEPAAIFIPSKYR